MRGFYLRQQQGRDLYKIAPIGAVTPQRSEVLTPSVLRTSPPNNRGRKSYTQSEE